MLKRTVWELDRQEATATGGMVAAKTAAAAEAGTATLRSGGNAIDAAVVTAFAAAVAEPWMNGLGGGGYLVAYLPAERRAVTVAYPMLAPAGATETMFPLAGTGVDSALFGWPAVVDNANVVGHRAVGVPGTVAGLALALERFGTISFAEALEPAIRLAEEGVPVTWHTTLTIARDLANLRRFPATAAIFCPDGLPPTTLEQANPTILRQPDLAQTLRLLASEGPRAFYEGPLAHRIVDHLQEGGANFTLEDLSRYTATVTVALETAYRDHQVHTIGGGTGGTTLVEALNLLTASAPARAEEHNSPATLHRMAQAFRLAFADRFAYMADPAMVDVPLTALTSDSYARERANQIDTGTLKSHCAGSRNRLGVTHTLASSAPDYTTGGSTTHLSVVDSKGMAVSLTQTLLSLWGSRVVVPGTGILLNNGMMWFDPEPGRPNSIAGGKFPLSNMAPVILTRDGRVVASLGASGGRRIMNCNVQLIRNLVEFGMSIQPAISAPRVDASTADLLVSARLPVATTESLQELGHRVAVRREDRFLGDFGSPVGIQVASDGSLRGGADPYYEPATALGIGTEGDS
ncbi:MAG: gamma-glutamyltransferase [Chloroflexia bacterium]|nr:gamma-glutamyltransferase [Chloroflexia bacterium]